MDSLSTLNRLNNATAAKNFQEGQKNLGSNTIGKDGFMQLLLAQLKFQDPSNPVSDKEFISQQAQFTQIEKLDNLTNAMNRSADLSQAGMLVGKNVTYKDDAGNEHSGMVSSVLFGTDGIAMKIGNQEVTPDRLTKISAVTTP
jgi:flagellar basal-body rod modification protein FlgD